jgi:hypothetical protein
MKYYKDEQNQVYVYESDGSQDAYIKPGLTPITEYEADALRFPPPTPEQIAEQRRAEILARLNEIDAASIRPLRAIAEGTAVEADHAKLAELDAEAAELRTELAGLLGQAG